MSKIMLYLRQAWTMISQNKLFSGIYIAGTGISVALTITLFIIIYVKIAPIYPEYNRDRTLNVMKVERTLKDTTSSNYWSGMPSYEVVKMLRELPHVDAVTGSIGGYFGLTDTYEVSTENNIIEVTPLYTDADYWKVFDFEFLRGKQFDDADVKSGIKVAVVSESFAKTLFKTDDIVGRTFDFMGLPYNVKGVVKDVPASLSTETAADLWIPHTIFDETDVKDANNELIGNYFITITAKSTDDIDVLKQEIAEMIHRYNQQDKIYNHSMISNSVLESELGFTSSSDMNDYIKIYLYILVALLFIPALNLSGMISSKMHKRLAELGIRKAYGATNRQILVQVLWENLLLTLCGGLVGLILSYVIVMLASDWIINILNVGFNLKTTLLSGDISAEMMFNWQVFGAAILVSFFLNFISAIIPAVMSLRHTIINSLNSK